MVGCLGSAFRKRYSKRTHTILLMQFLDPPCVPSALDDIVVVLVPECRRSYLRARELGQRAKVQPIHHKRGEIDNEEAYGRNKKVT